MVKRVLLWVAAAFVVLVIGLVVVIAMQPSEFHVERSATMNAPPEEVFTQVNDFHNWEGWSPWLELDPNAKETFEGPTSGEGAVFRWAGNDEVGEGSMTIVESRPNELIRINLHFLKPMDGTATTDFTFQPTGEQTTVTWTMDGQNNFIAKAMCLLVFDMEEMIGSNYEKGLASMKAIVEAPEAAAGDESPKPAVETTTGDNSNVKDE
jgi:uncharacterized protein YndB with AHSA1/START domain